MPKYSHPNFLTSDHSNQPTDAPQNITARSAGQSIWNLNERLINGAKTDSSIEADTSNLASVGWVLDKLSALNGVTESLKEPILSSLQLDDAEGILPAFGLHFSALPDAGASVSILSDTHALETFTEGVDWNRGASVADAMTSLASAITSGTSFKAKYCTGLAEFFTSGIIIICPKAAPAANDDFRAYGSDTVNTVITSYSASTANESGTSAPSDYALEKLAGSFAISGSDPGADVDYSGFMRLKADLSEPETHPCLNENHWQMWNAGASSGAGAWAVITSSVGIASNGLASGGAIGTMAYKNSVLDYATSWSVGAKITDSGNSLDAQTLRARGTSGQQGKIELYEDPDNGTNKITLKGPAGMASDIEYTFPASGLGASKIFVIDASGVITLSDLPSSGSGGFQAATNILLVSPTAADAADDSDTTTPFLTINGALAEYTSGDQLVLAPGTLTEDISLTAAGTYIFKSLIGPHSAREGLQTAIVSGKISIAPVDGDIVLGMEGIKLTDSGAAATISVDTTNHAAFMYAKDSYVEATGAGIHSVECNTGVNSFSIYADNSYLKPGSGGKSIRHTKKYSSLHRFHNCLLNDVELRGTDMVFQSCHISGALTNMQADTARLDNCVFDSGTSACFHAYSGAYTFNACTLNSNEASGFFLKNSGYTALLNNCSTPGTATKIETPSVATLRGNVQKKKIVLTGAGINPTSTAGISAGGEVITISGEDIVAAIFPTGSNLSGFWGPIPIPDDYNGGPLKFKVFWSCANASTNSAQFSLQAKALADSSALSTTYGTAQTVTDANNAADDENISGWSGDLTPGGSPAGGNSFYFKLTRLGASDSLLFDARLHSVLIDYTSSGKA